MFKLIIVSAINATLFLFPFWTITAKRDYSKEKGSILKARETSEGLNRVINHAFCDSSLSDEDKMTKKTLKEIHTYAELAFDPHGNLPDSFTICSAIMTPSCPSEYWPTFFSILGNDMRHLFSASIRHKHLTSYLFFYYHNGRSKSVVGEIPPLFPNQWTKSCMATNTTSGIITWVVEGVLIMNKTFEDLRNSTNRLRDLSRKLVLGAGSFAGTWRASSSKVTNLNVFSSALSTEKMRKMTEGGICAEKGDYLAWEDMEWILHGQATIETVDQATTYKRKSYANLYYTNFKDWEACMIHCKKLGSRVPSVTTLNNWLKLQKSLKEDLYDKGLNTMRLWLPITERRKDGEWRDFYTGNVIQNYTLPWRESGSFGENEQNCGFLEDENTWGESDCSYDNYACICTQEPEFHLELRGSFPSTTVDRYYKITNDQDDIRKMTFHGLEQTSITYDSVKEIWILSMSDTNISLTSSASHSSFILGKHNWTVKGSKDYKQGDQFVTELKMTGCRRGDFTCNSGECINIEERCNQKFDCSDESDERDCRLLVLNDGYNKRLPPRNIDGSVDVIVTLDILRLVDIDENDYSIKIQFEITMIWKENRATYQNLKIKDSLNALEQSDFEQLWLPKVVYENTDQKETTRLGSTWEWETTVLVRREGNYTLSGLDVLDETEIFTGDNNSLIMSQRYTHAFYCAYMLSAYPFDTQVSVSKLLSIILIYHLQTCYIDMAIGSLDRDTVFLVPGQLNMSESKDMPIFRMIHWELKEQRFDARKHGLRLVIVMKRKVVSELMTTYFPSTLLIAITFATAFFKPFFFEAALSVNLTTMLVMTTIFISKMESLPSTSDIKMIDIWLIFCQIYPFVEVVLLTAREYHRDEKRVGDKMMSMDVPENDEEIESEGIRCQSCQHPTFEITGRDFRNAYFLLLLFYCCFYDPL